MQIEETTEAYQLRMNRLNHVQTLMNMINSKRKKARLVFDSLQPGQKQYLLKASGINRSLSSINHLSDSEIEQLHKGLARIKAICDAFSYCKEGDFKTTTHTQQVA